MNYNIQTNRDYLGVEVDFTLYKFVNFRQTSLRKDFLYGI